MNIHKQEYQSMATPNNVIKRLQNKKDVNVFENAHNQRLDIKLSWAQIISQHSMQIKLDRPVAPHFREMWNHSHSCVWNITKVHS